MQRAANKGLQKESSNGSKQTETMLTFWPAFEIKYAFVIYFAVAAAAVSLLYPSIISTYWKDFVSDFPSSSSFRIAWLCESGLWFIQSVDESSSKVRWMPSCLQFSIMEAHSRIESTTTSTICWIHKRMLENDTHIYAHTHITVHILIHTLNMYCAV